MTPAWGDPRGGWRERKLAAPSMRSRLPGYSRRGAGILSIDVYNRMRSGRGAAVSAGIEFARFPIFQAKNARIDGASIRRDTDFTTLVVYKRGECRCS